MSRLLAGKEIKLKHREVGIQLIEICYIEPNDGGTTCDSCHDCIGLDVHKPMCDFAIE